MNMMMKVAVEMKVALVAALMAVSVRGKGMVGSAEINKLENTYTDEAWYVPGWMRTSEPDVLAWNSFTNVFPAAENRFHKWDGNRLWPIAAKNADAEAVKLADEIRRMPEKRRAHLTLVGHSLGGRIVARALAKLSLHGIKIKRGILLAPAIPAEDSDLEKMGLGSEEPMIVVANPDDVALKYVYAVAGGENSPAYGASTTFKTPENVKEIPVSDDIAKSTVIAAIWGRFDAVKEVANHHASFYFEELSRVLDGKQSKGVCVMAPQDKINFEWKVIDAGVWWHVLDEKCGWKLERNIVTGHCRIINPQKVRVAWGECKKMGKAFKKVQSQQVY